MSSQILVLLFIETFINVGTNGTCETMKEMSIHRLKKILLESPDDVSDLIKAAAHAHRLHILALLTDGPTEFSVLLDAVKVSKTALANHLTHMMNKGLVERSDRGMYQITKDGQDLLSAVAGFYEGSKTRELNRLKQMKDQYSRGYRPMEGFQDEKVVSNPPLMQDTWLTYVGAVTGVLQSLGIECEVADVGGYSGYTFLVNVAQGVICPSGPTAHNAWEEIHKGTESLGWKLKTFCGSQYPLSQHVTPEDRARAWDFFEIVKKEIDERGNPVVVWGIPVPEYGIVTGYKGDSYVASTVRQFNNQPETPIRYDALQAPGCMEAIFFVEKIPVPEYQDKNALNRALQMAEGIHANKGYVSGPAAYDEWAAVLETGAPDKVDYFGNSYVGVCVYDSKGLAAQFLEKLAKKYVRSVQADFLTKAAQEYSEAEVLLKEFVTLFPFAHTGEMLFEDRKRGAEILQAVKTYEVSAITQLKMALQNWE